MKLLRYGLRPLCALALSVPACGDAAADKHDSDSHNDSDTESYGSSRGDGSHGDTESADESSDTDGTAAGCNIDPPTTWTAPNWEANAAEALALRAALDGLVGSMRMVEEGTGTIADAQELVAAYEAGSPSLSSVTSAGYDPVVRAAFAEFVDLAAAGPQDLVDDAGQWTPGAAGGIFGTSFRGLNEGGLEVRQLVDKGLFSGGALYRWALAQASNGVDEATVDALAAAWGANSNLDPMGELTDAANYTHEMGFHGQMAEALIAAKAYAADGECVEQRDRAVRSFFRTWELAMMARLVFYANEAAAQIELATTDDEFAAALHGLAEGAGLALGFLGLEDPTDGPLAGEARVVTDEQLSQIATALGIMPADLGASTTGTFVQNYLDFVDAVVDVEAVITTALSLSPADIENFREPVAG